MPLSTEAEIIYEKLNIHRVHVTGINACTILSFINRAEDQAFINP